jgi:hypothetical protein
MKTLILTMALAAVETWTLWVRVSDNIRFKGGEYQTEERCMAGARMQQKDWRIIYGDRVIWRCKRDGPH